MGGMKQWSVQVNYDARDDNGKKCRARATMQVEAADIPGAYREADKIKEDKPEVTLGAILPGWHSRF